MPAQRNYRYIYTAIISFSILAISYPRVVFAQSDTTATDTTGTHKVKKKETAGRQLTLGVDVFHPATNYFIGNQDGFELEATYYTRNDYYLVLDGGGGGANVNYSNLQYSTTNNFFRFGFDKSVLPRNKPKDWDMMFIGLDAATAIVKRSAASYLIVDSTWGNTSGPPQGASTFPAIWAELTGGMRVEIAKNLIVGWNIRGKFMLNARSFNDPSPLYIAGYGRGDKNAVFDFDLYLNYALRWDRKVKAGEVKTK